MATKDEKIKALEQKQAQIKARIQALKARDTVQDRKDETRRKILIGGFVLAQLKKGGKDAAVLSLAGLSFADTLKSDRDRELFGLAPLAAPAALSPAASSGGAVSEEGH
jgi:hypothetical protein